MIEEPRLAGTTEVRSLGDEMKNADTILRILTALLIGVAISVVTYHAPSLFRPAEDSFVPSSFITHTLMWVLSILAIAILTKGQLAQYGFTKGRFHLTPTIFLWVLPTMILSVMAFFASGPGQGALKVVGLSQLRDIVFIWFYASISEEIFARGLLQSFLSPLSKHGLRLSTRLRLSLPVLLAGLYFGMMHIVLWKQEGPAAIVVIVLSTCLGIVAGYYREKSESLWPAIIIHALFNVGGSLPIWLLCWLLG